MSENDGDSPSHALCYAVDEAPPPVLALAFPSVRRSVVHGLTSSTASSDRPRS